MIYISFLTMFDSELLTYSNASKNNIVIVFNDRILLVRKGLIKGQEICDSIKYPQ